MLKEKGGRNGSHQDDFQVFAHNRVSFHGIEQTSHHAASPAQLRAHCAPFFSTRNLKENRYYQS